MAHYIKEEDNFRLTSVLFQGNRTLCESRKNIHKISAVKKEKNKVNSVRAVRKRETKRNKSISFGSQFRNLNERKKPVESSRIDFEEEKEKKRILQGWMSPHGGATSGDIVFLFTNRIQFVIPFIIDWKNLLVARVTVSWNGQPAAGRATGLSIGWPHRLFPPPLYVAQTTSDYCHQFRHHFDAQPRPARFLSTGGWRKNSIKSSESTDWR